ncbi:SVM family protein [uncultured Bacteroides sp.]
MYGISMQLHDIKICILIPMGLFLIINNDISSSWCFQKQPCFFVP